MVTCKGLRLRFHTFVCALSLLRFGLIASLFAAAAAHAQTPIYQINSGGGAASPFLADEFNTGGQAATPVTNTINTSGVTNPAPQAVWQTEYYCCTTGPGNFSYTLPNLTPGTTYQVRLDFSENYNNGAGLREFNVVINGVQVLTNFDVFSTAGGEFKAIEELKRASLPSQGVC